MFYFDPYPNTTFTYFINPYFYSKIIYICVCMPIYAVIYIYLILTDLTVVI